MSIKILVNGANGRMGQATLQTIAEADDFECVAEGTRSTDLAELIQTSQPDIAIDFTTAECVYQNTLTIIEHNVHPVIGATGLTTEQLNEVSQRCKLKKLGGIIAPNFSIGVILMMKFAAYAVKYLPSVEITELHHDQKLDSPSGTAIKTADMIADQAEALTASPSEKEIIPGARGAVHRGIHIHSVRLPGLLAHQEVRFGGQAESLSIRHDSLDRTCFMPGVLLACRKVLGLNEMIYGLENLLIEEQ